MFFRVIVRSKSGGPRRVNQNNFSPRQVEITRPFELSATEVSNAQYELFEPHHRALRHIVFNLAWLTEGTPHAASRPAGAFVK